MNKSISLGCLAVFLLYPAAYISGGMPDTPPDAEKPPETSEPASPVSGSDSAESESEERYRLIYRFEPGDMLRYETKQSITMEAVVLENRKTDRTEVIQRRLYRVHESDQQGVAQVSMQFEHVRMQLQSDDQPAVVFDSSMKDSEIPQLFRLTADRLKGSAARYRVTTDGRPAGSSEDTASSAGEQGEAGGDNQTFLMPLPQETVAVGDTWKDTQTVKVRVTKDINREIEILRTFRLESVNDGIARIAFNSSISSSVRNPVVRAQLMQSAPRGTLEFDIARGIMLRKQLRFDETVVNAMGENTVVTSYGLHTEELLPSGSPEEPQTSEVAR